MKLFIIPSWYPTQIHPESGSFFQDRAILINQTKIEVHLIASIQHSFLNMNKFRKMNKKSFETVDGLSVFKNEMINIYPTFEKKAFYRFQKHLINHYNEVIQKIGRPDLVFFNSSLWSGCALSEYLYKNQIPYMISEHLKEFLLPDGFSSFQYRKLDETYKNCASIIATSTELKKSIARQFSYHSNKLCIIPNPVDENIFSLKPEKETNNSITIICISLFRPEKRLDIVISTIYNLIKKGANITLKIIGDGPLKSDIKKQIKSLKLIDNVQLLGYLNQSEIIKQLHISDMLILASEVETFGVVLVEAQMCGLPVVSTDCGGPRDIITKETGKIVKPKSINSLTAGINEIIENLDKFCPARIREKTIAQFGAKAYKDSISKLVKKNINSYS